MVKHTQQFVGKLSTNCLSVFDNTVGLEFKGLIIDGTYKIDIWKNQHRLFNFNINSTGSTLINKKI